MAQTDTEILNWIVYGNTLSVWLLTIGAFLAAFVALQVLKNVLIRQVKRISSRTTAIWDDVLGSTLIVTRTWLLIVFAVWVASLVPTLPERTVGMIGALAIFAFLVQLGIWATAAIRSYVDVYGQRNLDQDAAGVMTVRALGFLASIGLWAVIGLVVLENFGVDVTALLAGLGIGGIAVALAAQNILGDLFGSLSIVLDKPFVVGDFIIVGEHTGTVERVGLKTTRLRSLSGEQLVFANSDLLQSRIRNFRRMFERRAVFTFGVEYGTPREKLEWIPAMVREIIEGLTDVRFDRAHFHRYGDSSLDFEVVYYVLVPDYVIYMDRQQTINLEIYRRLEENDIAFAFPTRTLHLVSSTRTGVDMA